MANPFAITPASSFALEGLGAIPAALLKRQQMKQAEAAQAAQTAEIQGALESRDPQLVLSVMAKYPELGQQIQAGYNFATEQTQQDMANTAFDVLREIRMGGTGQEALQGRMDRLTGQVDLTQTAEGMQLQPEQLEQFAMLTLAELAPERLEAVQQLMPQQDVKVGRFRYLETPTGFLKVDTATGQREEITIGSKEADLAEAERQKQAEQDLEQEQTTFQRAEKLRKEYNTRSKEFFAVRDAFDRIEASVAEPDPAGDIALIFNYMKMLDPGSVVREGEFATAQNAGSVAESVYNLYNRVLQGTRLTEKQRDMFKGRAEKLFDKAKNRNESDLQQVLDLGRRYDITREDIFGQPIDPGIQVEFPDVQARLSNGTSPATTGASQQTAPPQAIAYLRANPQFAEQFRQKYGYLPEGF